MLVATLKAVLVRDQVLRDVADKLPPPRPVDEMIGRECTPLSVRFSSVWRCILGLC